MAALVKTHQEKMEAVHHLEALQNMYNKLSNDMKSEFLKKLGIIKDIASLQQQQQQQPTKMLDHVQTIMAKYTIPKYINITDELYPGFTDKLDRHFPNVKLTELEKVICCLIACGFTNQEIAFFIHKNKDTQSVDRMRNRIRQKLNVPHAKNFQDFLIDIYRNN